jgi:hypothetical protein
MLQRTSDLEKYTIGATDGTIGKVKDFYFDDEFWVVRYIVVETGSWLSSRKVLVSPFAVGQPDREARILPVSLDKERVKNSPNIDLHKPVSRQHEIRYLGYYGYPYYWRGPGLWGEGPDPASMLTGVGYGGADEEYRRLEAENERQLEALKAREHDDPHLRSCANVIQYDVHATDGDIGHVQEFLIDERSFAIRYIVVDTSNWWLGHKVLVSPDWAVDVSWSASKLTVDLTRQAVKDSPPYDPSVPLERDEERRVYEHYGRSAYWQERSKRRVA